MVQNGGVDVIIIVDNGGEDGIQEVGVRFILKIKFSDAVFVAFMGAIRDLCAKSLYLETEPFCAFRNLDKDDNDDLLLVQELVKPSSSEMTDICLLNFLILVILLRTLIYQVSDEV